MALFLTLRYERKRVLLYKFIGAGCRETTPPPFTGIQAKIEI